MVPLALVFLAPLAAADSFNLSETLTSHMILQQAPARAVSPLLHAGLGGGRGERQSPTQGGPEEAGGWRRTTDDPAAGRRSGAGARPTLASA